MGRKKDETGWKLHFAPWMQDCFGRPRWDFRDECPCPPTCREICGSIRLDENRSPRVDRGYYNGRMFAPIWSALLGRWQANDPDDAIKLSYAFLITYSRAPDFRWIYARVKTLAEARGVKKRTFENHLAWLEEHGLIRRLRRRDLDPNFSGPDYTIVLLDVPDWLPLETRASEAEPADFPPGFGRRISIDETADMP